MLANCLKTEMSLSLFLGNHFILSLVENQHNLSHRYFVAFFLF